MPRTFAQKAYVLNPENMLGYHVDMVMTLVVDSIVKVGEEDSGGTKRATWSG